jgi:hypothetical protein
MQKNKMKIIGLVLLVLVFLSACTSKTIVYPSTSTGPVSFSKDVLPLFANNCAKSGCHITGGIAPDLSAGNAFNSLISGGYVNTTTPAQSLIYTVVISSGAMNSHLPNFSDQQVILNWIKQGANNN